MERLVKGDIIVIEFPFSDLEFYKRRPALIIKVPQGDDVIICQITGSSHEKEVEIPIKNSEFTSGGLKKESYIRIDKITTIKTTRIKYKIGSLKKQKFERILETLCNYLKI